MFITHDCKYILRPVCKEENKYFLKHTLRHYHQRILANTFLQKIYGIYKLTYRGVQVRVMVQKNHHQCLSHLTEVYNIDDKISLRSKSTIVPAGASSVFINMSSEERSRFFGILKLDLEFLKNAKIINYDVKIIGLNNLTCPLSFDAVICDKQIRMGFCLMNIFTKNKQTSYGLCRKRCQILACANKYANDIIEKLDYLIL